MSQTRREGVMGLGDYMSETPILNRLRHGGKVLATGVFPWPVLRDEDPRNRIFVLRDRLREDS